MWSVHNVPRCGTYRAARRAAYRMAVRPYIEFAEGKHIDKNSLQEQKSIFLLSQSGRMARRRCRLGVQKGACGTHIVLPETDRKPVRGRQVENKGNRERACKKVPVAPVEDSRKGGKGGNGLLFPVGCGIIKGQAALPLGASESSVSERKRRCGRQSCKK